jgi:hypothetical protein
MIPIVASLLGTLAQNGLGLLSSAIQAKGKEVVENTLGVKISDNPTDAEVAKLRQLQFDHEERLLELGIEKARQDLESFKEEVKDRDSARDRDVEFIKRGVTNNRANLMFFLAVVMVGAMVWIVWKDQNINEYVKGIFTLVLGRFLGYLDNIYSFEFGTTRGSKEKDETIKQLTGGSK